MSLMGLLAVLLILALIGVLPSWPYARNWGGGVSGAIVAILLILLIAYLFGVRF